MSADDKPAPVRQGKIEYEDGNDARVLVGSDVPVPPVPVGSVISLSFSGISSNATAAVVRLNALPCTMLNKHSA